jgi:hypothetical protein
MEEHPVALIVSIMSGVFGGVFLIAFILPFDDKVMASRRADEAPPEKKVKSWIDLILSSTGRYQAGSSASEYKSVWQETKGMRFLVPLGLALCFISWLVHRIWLT